jgi:hypothetical protein
MFMRNFLFASLTQVKFKAFWACISDSFYRICGTTWAVHSLMNHCFWRFNFLKSTYWTIMNLINKARHQRVYFLFNKLWNFIFNIRTFFFLPKSFLFWFFMSMPTMFSMVMFFMSFFSFSTFLNFYIFLWFLHWHFLLFRILILVWGLLIWSININSHNLFTFIHLLHCIHIKLTGNHNWITIFI